MKQEYVRALHALSKIARQYDIWLTFEFLGFGWCSVRTPRAAYEILQAANDTGVPARLLKNVFSRESQIWPGIYKTYREAGLGQLTDNGADTILLWNAEFYHQFCPLVLDAEHCERGYVYMNAEDQALLRGARRIEAARGEGLHVTADMYLYHASATGLDSIMPPWVQEGGHRAWIERLKDPAIRERLKAEMVTPSDEWESRAAEKQVRIEKRAPLRRSFGRLIKPKLPLYHR